MARRRSTRHESEPERYEVTYVWMLWLVKALARLAGLDSVLGKTVRRLIRPDLDSVAWKYSRLIEPVTIYPLANQNASIATLGRFTITT